MLLSLLVGPITTLIERLFPDQEKQNAAKAEMLQIMAQADKEQYKARGEVVLAEAQGESWLQRNWRPLTMMFFLFLLGSYWFGFAPDYLIQNPNVVEHLFTLLEIGIGGYIVGRSSEKLAKEFNNKRFFDSIRKDAGSLTQEQVDLLNKAINKAKET